MLSFSSHCSRFLSLSLALSAVLGTGVAHAAATQPQIAIKNAKVTEGNSGLTPLVFTVSLTKASKEQVAVDYKSIARTATASQDFKSVKGTLLFAPGVTKLTISVNVVGEGRAEENETLFVHLSLPKRSTIRTADAIGTIVNDDGTPIPKPGTGKIVFASASAQGYGLFTMNSDGTNLTRVSTDFYDRLPAWSPDGTKIAFRSYFLNPVTNSYTSGIGVMNANGKNRVQLTSGEFGAVKPLWSGDGRTIFFRASSYGNQGGGIYSVQVKGGAVKRLTSSSTDGEPSVSRQTGKIVFLSYATDAATNYAGYQIFSMNSNGTGRQQLTSSADEASNFSPQISADGKTVIFVKSIFDINSLHVINIDGTNERRIVDVYNNDLDPFIDIYDIGLKPIISLDGRKALFTVLFEGVTTTYVVDLIKKTTSEVTSESTGEVTSLGTTPVFSPDGSRIAFVSSRDGNPEIYAVNIDGSKEVRLTNNFDADSAPDFGVGVVPEPPIAVTPPQTAAVKAPSAPSSSANKS